MMTLKGYDRRQKKGTAKSMALESGDVVLTSDSPCIVRLPQFTHLYYYVYGSSLE